MRTKKYAIILDTKKCLNCKACTVACKLENAVAVEEENYRNWVTELPLQGSFPNLHQEFRPSQCQHCENAPCVEVCMVQASYYRPDGIVMMDYDKCIGCRYCEVACPYQARSFNWEKFEGPNPAVPEWGQPEVERRPRGVPEKCSFCYQRIDRVWLLA